MSINTLPQAPKPFDRFSGTQDHGTRGNPGSYENYDICMEEHAARRRDFAEAEEIDITDGVKDFRELPQTQASIEAKYLADSLYDGSGLDDDFTISLGPDDEYNEALILNEDFDYGFNEELFEAMRTTAAEDEAERIAEDEAYKINATIDARKERVKATVVEGTKRTRVRRAKRLASQVLK